MQRACRARAVPGAGRIRDWAAAAYRVVGSPRGDLELTVRIVDEDEARELNRTYRGRDYVPNVLSFPLDSGGPVDTGLLGDVVICAAMVDREAKEQRKPAEAHWCHLVVHGVLHCCGFEHETEGGAERMESMERRILAEFGFPDPYTVADEQ